MAFPTTPVIDDFDRANETPLAGNWTQPLRNEGGVKPINLDTNVVLSSASKGSGYWNPTTFGPNSEAYLTLSTLPTGGDSIVVVLRAKEEGGSSTADGYSCEAEADNLLIIARFDNSVTTVLGATIAQTLTAGEKIGAEMIGDTLTCYYFTGGAWANKGNRTDATYGAAGHIGFEIQGTAGRGNDFGGGNIAGNITITGVRALATASGIAGIIMSAVQPTILVNAGTRW